MSKSIAACAALFLVSAALLAGEQQPPPFKSGIDLVEVDAVVDDGKGHPVKGLRQDEFAIREDGQPAAIQSFLEMDAEAATTNNDARFVVLLFDDWTAPINTTNVKRIARRFIEKLGDHDSIAILRVNGDAVASPMTRADALAAADAFRASGTATTMTGLARTQHVLEMIGSVSRQMTPIAHRRKTLVFIGATGYISGGSTPDTNPSPSRVSSSVASAANTEPTATTFTNWFGVGPIASRANVAVYAIDPAVLTNTRRTTVFERDSSGFATETGGEIFVGPVFDRAVDQIWDEAGHYYVIGYEAPRGGRRGNHRIDVKVSRSGTKIHVRRTRAD
jgi:VWFA-related protein